MRNMKIKPSFYNMVLAKEPQLIVYNTATGKLVKCFAENAVKVADLLDRDCIEYIEDDPYLKAMYDKGLLVDFERDEIEEMRKIEEKAMFGEFLQLIILPTEQCNFRCVYCYEHFERGKMSEETQDSIVRYVEENISNYRGLMVGWFGGEPTEAMDVVESLSTRLLEICKKYRKAYNAGITTNGYSLTPDVFKRLKRLHVTEYQITLDGIPSIHNKQRVLVDGGPTFDVILNNLVTIKNEIKSSTVTFILRTNFSQEMLGNVDEFCEIIDRNFGDDKRFNCFWQMVTDYGYVKDDKVRDIFGKPKDYRWLIQNYPERFMNGMMGGLYGPNGGVCYALKRNEIVVDSSGNIRKCTCNLESEENNFGKIGKSFDPEKHDAWLNSRLITEGSKCVKCKKRPICHNRPCYSAKNCLVNLSLLENVLLKMAEDEKYFEVIDGRN